MSPPVHHSATPERPARVLVVDDEVDVRDLVGFNLRAAGLDVLFAQNGAEAVTRVRQERPDLVILDLMLPEMDGVSVCEMIRNFPETAATPVIMLTAWATDRARLVGFQVGADEYITKPFSPRELVRRVQTMLGESAALRRRREPVPPVKQVTVDLVARRVVVDGRDVELDTHGFRILTVVLEAVFHRTAGLQLHRLEL